MLAEDFDTILHNLGMAWLEHPLFHHAPVSYTHLLCRWTHPQYP